MSKWSAAFRDSRWQKLRLEIMERDGWTCRSCFKKDGVTLNVHHAYYEAGKAPWEYPKETLVTFCEECHKKRHDLQKQLLVRLSTLPFFDLLSTVYAVDCFPTVCGKMFDMTAECGIKIGVIDGMLNTLHLAYKAGLACANEQEEGVE